jgi:integrase
LRFFFGVSGSFMRTPRKLPSILSADEVVRFLEAVPSLKTRVALTTAYATGLRAAIGHLLDLFNTAECRNYFAAARYDATRSAIALRGTMKHPRVTA